MSEEPVDKAKAISITLTPRSRKVIEGIRDDTGVPNTEAMTRILEWFAGLDRKLRLAVLTRDEDTKRELTRLVLTEMAGFGADPAMTSTEVPVTAEAAARLAHLMIDRLRQISDGRQRESAERGTLKRRT